MSQATLPLVDVGAGEWPPLRAQLRIIVGSADKRKYVPADQAAAVAKLLAKNEAMPEETAAAVQKLLDPHCLAMVSINPESRVKVARGPAEALLVQGVSAYVLIKVQNDAGVTARLGVSGPQIIAKGTDAEGRWLEAIVPNVPPLSNRLLGQRLEYKVVRLRSREAGKREATLRFDVGQGSQDLGFRAEVPILFRCEAGGGK